VVQQQALAYSARGSLARDMGMSADTITRLYIATPFPRKCQCRLLKYSRNATNSDHTQGP